MSRNAFPDIVQSLTVKDQYPLPRITDLFGQLQDKKVFTTIDLKSGYCQLPLDARDAKKTLFNANCALYHFTCLPFGVCNGPNSFIMFMRIITRGLPNITCYLDNILCESFSMEEHIQDLRALLEGLAQYSLKIVSSECRFIQKEVRFLGFFVNGQYIRLDLVKVDVIILAELRINVSKINNKNTNIVLDLERSAFDWLEFSSLIFVHYIIYE